MTESLRRRSRGWKMLGLVAGVIGACAGLLLLWVNAVAERKVQLIDEKSKVKIARWHARDAARPVLRGTASPGNAWDDYALAMAETKGMKDGIKLGAVVFRDPKTAPELGSQALAARPKALDLLRLGAGRATSRYPYEWEQGPEMSTPGLLAAQTLSNLGILKARALADEGMPREAVGWLLDVGQFGRDLGDDGVLICEMIGHAILDLALTEAKDLLAAGKLDADSLRDLDAGLTVLDASFPNHARTLENESMFMGGALRKYVAAASWNVERLLLADMYLRSDHTMTRAGKAEELPWTQKQKEIEEIVTEGKSSWNPLYKTSIPGVLGTSRVGRDRHAQLRLLRSAVHFGATGEVLELADPYGAALKVSRGADTLKVWSVGSDGVDDGGVGAWKPGGKDIVLDVKR